MLGYEIVYIVTSPLISFAVYKLLHTFFDKQISKKRTEFISFFCYTVLLSAMIFVTRVPLIMLTFNLVSIFLLSFNYKSFIQKKIVVTSLIYSILLLIEIIVSVGVGVLDISIYENSPFTSVIGLILIRIVTMIATYLLSRYKNSNIKDYPLTSIYYLAFTVVLFGTLYLFVTSLENDSLTVYSVIISGIILIVVNITMIIIDEKIYNALLETNEKRILKQQNIAYEKQAEIINESIESIKALRHDMKNHIMMLNEMYKSNKNHEIEIYIGKIFNEIQSEDFSKSNNFVIDSIINFKLRKLIGTDTNISTQIFVPETIKVLAYDLTVILGNLLDNAITAVLKSKDKKLDLQISCSMGNLIILMENSFDGKIISQNGRFETTKFSVESHGIGLKNVEKSLEKYDGEIRIEYTPNIFSIAVIIPCEQ